MNKTKIRRVGTRRMLHNKISKSLQVNNLPVEARLLFTWMISHADEEGRLRGEPEYIKGTVFPLTTLSIKKIKTYLELMHKEELIYYWFQNNHWYIQFIKWEEHQYFRKDRLEPSILPTYCPPSDNQQTAIQQTEDSSKTSKSNISQENKSEPNVVEVDKSESSENKDSDVAN